MAGALIDPAVCGFPTGKVKLLTDAGACRDAVAHHLSKWLPEQAKQAEIVVIYFAGHGAIHGVGRREEGYLLAHDADPEDLVTRGILMDNLSRWVEAVDAAAVVICLDCCHAGKLIPRGAPATDVPARDMRIRPDMLQALAGRGRYLITSCDAGQVSVESEDWGHGLFTYHLLAGLRGPGDRDGDGRVGIAELFEYVAEAVERDAKTFGAEQRPWVSSIGPGGVYLSAPRREGDARRLEVGRASILGTAQRLWREQGPPDAICEIERAIDAADASEVIALLDLLIMMKDPGAIPVLFRCLAHCSQAVRDRARRAVQALGWEDVTAAVEELARRGDGHVVDILDGLAAFEAHRETVALLDRLVTLLKGEFRNRAIFLLERKQQALELERVAEVFREAGSPYQVRKALGQGLFTAAYLARDDANELDVVVRVLRPEFANDPHVRAEFLDLTRRSVRLVHHNLVLTREVRAFPGRNVYCAVRDYVDGVTLQKRLESGREFSPDQIIKIARQVLQALSPLHADGMTHGSVKPSNIFLSGEDRVVLGDLALPMRSLTLAISLRLRRFSYDGQYAPPEMFREGGAFGPPADFYSLGCLAYELSCGTPPFASDDPGFYFALASRDDQQPAEPPSRRGSRLGLAGDPFILRLIAKDSSERFRNAEEALQALDELASSLRLGIRTAPLRAAPSEIRPIVRRAVDDMMSIVITTDELFALGGDTLHSGPEAGGQGRESDVDPPPQRLGRYVLLRRLGAGGMGRVWVAQDESTDRTVAIKMLYMGGDSPAVRARFVKEAKTLSRLHHPNFVSVLEFDETAAVPFIVTELLEGSTLAFRIHEKPLEPDEAARLMAKLARAIHHAHTLGIIHRDLKPSNIILTEDGTPKIIDFGLAREIGRADESDAETRAEAIVGTVAFMAPEQARGEVDRIGPASDIYSLGVTLYQILTGTLPFRGPILEILQDVQKAVPVAPSKHNRAIPRDLEAICLKCLEKDPGRRYRTAAELADDLERFCERRALGAATPGFWDQLRRLCSLNRSPGEARRDVR
jgi:serine/threonine protein kinase